MLQKKKKRTRAVLAGGERERAREILCRAQRELVAAAPRGKQEDGTLTHVSVITVAHVAAFSLASDNKASLMTESNNYRWARCIEL